MVLPFTENPFRGVAIEVGDRNEDADRFPAALSETVAELKHGGYSLAWLQLAPGRADLIPTALELGFEYHHADRSEGVLLVLRLRPDATVPGYATHFIGVGGVVLDDEGRLLVIQERHHRRKHYKLPGGALDPGEHIADAALREVLEETGIRTEFLSLHCFRHWHGYRYGKSDIYFVCRLRPLSFEITADPAEIAEAGWMPVQEYLDDGDTHPFNRRIVETALSTPGLRPGRIPGYGTGETHEMMF